MVVGNVERTSAHHAGSETAMGRMGSTIPSPPLPCPGTENAIIGDPAGAASAKLDGSNRTCRRNCTARCALGRESRRSESTVSA